jgi:branched-chain amino acid transport system ATP-binding protein
MIRLFRKPIWGEKMLEVNQLSLSYGKHEALSDVSLRLQPGEVIAILGANGAGKTSLLKSILGLTRPHSGSVVFNGRQITTLPSHQIVELGIALVPEGRRLIGPLTVHENLLLGAYAKRARRSEQKNLDYVFELFPRLRERRRQIVKTMSGGEQQMLAVGRALMSNPTTLLLDEPSLGLGPRIVQDLFAILSRIARESNLSILLVEQNARRALAMSTRAYLLANGRVVGEGPARVLYDDPMVARSYLGL